MTYCTCPEGKTGCCTCDQCDTEYTRKDGSLTLVCKLCRLEKCKDDL